MRRRACRRGRRTAAA